MKNYEYTYLTHANMSEENAKSLQDKLSELIIANGGTVTEITKSYRKRLAYLIKKQDSAYVNTILFSVLPENLPNFKKKTGKIEEIMRGLIIVRDPEKTKKESRRQRPMTAIKIQATTSATQEKVSEEMLATVDLKSEPESIKKEEKSAKPTARKEAKEPAKLKRKTKIKAELSDIEEKLDEILK